MSTVAAFVGGAALSDSCCRASGVRDSMLTLAVLASVAIVGATVVAASLAVAGVSEANPDCYHPTDSQDFALIGLNLLIRQQGSTSNSNH